MNSSSKFKKTIKCIREYNIELNEKLTELKNKKHKDITPDNVSELLLILSMLITANINVRYEIEDYISDTKAFSNLASIKNILNNCKLDLEALKSVSYTLVELSKSVKEYNSREEYRSKTL